jgi:hypothetical protein
MMQLNGVPTLPVPIPDFGTRTLRVRLSRRLLNPLYSG